MKRRALVAAVVVLASALSAAAVLRAGTSPRPVKVGSLRFAYPSRFDRRYFSSCSYAVTGVRGACVRGAVVASYGLTADPELGAAGASFRPDGVVFELYQAPRQQPDVVAPTVLPPLSLTDFHTVGRGPFPSTEQRELFFHVRGANYWAIAWVGKRSGKTDRAGLASLIGSIRIK